MESVASPHALDATTSMRESKLHPPHERPGTVPRTALVQRMLDHGAGQTIAMVAPPGYGKTTVLAQWSARQRNDVAWLSLDDSDNDPSSLLAGAAIAFGRVAGVDPPTVEAIASRSTSIPLAIDRLTAALGPARAVTLVLDHVENVASVESLDVIGDLAWRLPLGSQVAFASRSQLPIPTPVLRSRGMLMEIGPRELAMDEREASAVARRMWGGARPR